MATTEPRSGLKYGWALGENGWNADMDNDLKLIGRFGFHLSIKDRDLSTPPGSPADGDTYIVAAGGSGDWAAHDGNIAVWSATSSAWRFGVPRVGWLAYVEDDQVLSVFKSGTWSAGVAI